MHRCKDEVLSGKLQALRTAVPSKRLLRSIANRPHRAWTTPEPEAWDVLELMRKTDEKTTIVTCTRRGAALVNDLVLEVLFTHRHKTLLAEIPCDWDANMENFGDDNKVVQGRAPRPCFTKIFRGARLFLTKNLNKKEDFVNGMTAFVEDYDAQAQCLTVMTKTEKRLAVYLVEERVEKAGTVTYFPVRLGYACTVQKIQGQTLPHVTLFLDRPGCRAAGYVALSRVQYDEDYLIAGRVCPRHFVPAK